MSLVNRVIASLSFCVLFLIAACGRTHAPADISQFKFDSAHAIALDGVVSDGRMLSKSNNDVILQREIKEQLWYIVGVMNGQNGGADQSKLQVSIGEKKDLGDGIFEVHYAAKLMIAWPRERSVPDSYNVIVPREGNWTYLAKFFEQFNNWKCEDPSAHEVSMSIFWYYYRPESRNCMLAQDTAESRAWVLRLKMDLTVSKENSSNKSPEYAKIWEDGRLVATTIFGKEKSGATSNSDAGISGFNEMYRQARQQFGRPTSSNVPDNVVPGIKYPTIHATFDTMRGPLELHMFLVESIQEVDEAFNSQYNELTGISDYVSYSGHSGLGANIRALANKGAFKTGQYQLFNINGCDTFAYVDNALRDAHAKVNPQETSKDKHFDIITNAMPSFFHNMAMTNVRLLNAMVDSRQTYRQILEGLDVYQRAIVTGEQDNDGVFQDVDVLPMEEPRI